jgi:SAM-dependent methyltransferase
MSEGDKQRWDGKWSLMTGGSYDPNPLLTQYQSLLTGSNALDLACGRGQNAIWLAQHGYSVQGVDISQVALADARAQAETRGISQRVRFIQADLDEWYIPPSEFDLICVFRFLERSLFPSIRQALCPGGLLFYSTRHVGACRKHPGANPAYLLQPGELIEIFNGWKILHYVERSENTDLIARKRTSER